MLELLPSASRVASGTAVLTGAGPLKDWTSVRRATFMLDVTVAGSLVGDLLDVFLQSSPDGGTTWDDFVHFTQVLGNGGAKKFLAYWSREVVPETEIAAPADGTLAAGVKQGPTSSELRAKWIIANGGGTHDFTFKLGVDAGRS